jgi:hypothetical protein
MRKSTIIAIGVTVVMVLYFARVWARTAEVQSVQGPAMIALVQQHFEPSPKLLAMHPVGDFVWIATPNAVDCKFQRPQIKNCWEVYSGTNVVGPDLNGRSPGKIEVNFIVDADAMRLLGGNPPGGMMVRKGGASGEGAMDGEGGGRRGGKPDRPDAAE